MTVLFVFAYYPEALPFIKLYSFKLIFQLKNIRCWYAGKENMYVLVTGGGSVYTTAAISVFFEKFPSLKKDALCVNIGIAGSFKKPLHQTFYACKISNYHNNKTFYPDVFIKSNMAEVISIEFPANDEIMSAYPDALFDMEAYSFAGTCKLFVENHQIHCFKFVSDNDGVIKDEFEMWQHYEAQSSYILQHIQQIEKTIQSFFQNTQDITQELHHIISQLPITQTQKHQLHKAAMFYLSRQSNLNNFNNLLNEHNLSAYKHKSQKNKAFQKLLNILYNV